MSTLDDSTLQRLHDGDLEGTERAEAEAQLEASAADRERLASLGQLGELMRANLGGAAEEADLDDLWDRVRQRLPAPPPRRLGAWDRLRGWLSASMGTHPLRWVGAGAAVAAAAVVLTLLLVPGSADQAPPRTPMAKEAPSDDVTIKELDAPHRHPDVYQIKDGMRVTTVIWVHDDDEYDEDTPGANGTPDGDDI